MHHSAYQQCWRLISWLLLTFELGELNPGLDQKWDQQLEIALPLCKSRKLDRGISKVAVVIIYQIIDVACSVGAAAWHQVAWSRLTACRDRLNHSGLDTHPATGQVKIAATP